MDNLLTLDGNRAQPRFEIQAGLLSDRKFVNPGRRCKLMVVHEPNRSLDHMIDDLRRAGLPQDVDVEIITVSDLLIPWTYFQDVDSWDGPLRDRWGWQDCVDALRNLDQASVTARKLLRHEFPRWTIRDTANGDVASCAVIERAKRWQPDLVVIDGTELDWIERRELRRLIRRLTGKQAARCASSVRVPTGAGSIIASCSLMMVRRTPMRRSKPSSHGAGYRDRM